MSSLIIAWICAIVMIMIFFRASCLFWLAFQEYQEDKNIIYSILTLLSAVICCVFAILILLSFLHTINITAIQNHKPQYFCEYCGSLILEKGGINNGFD